MRPKITLPNRQHAAPAVTPATRATFTDLDCVAEPSSSISTTLVDATPVDARLATIVPVVTSVVASVVDVFAGCVCKVVVDIVVGCEPLVCKLPEVDPASIDVVVVG